MVFVAAQDRATDSHPIASAPQITYVREMPKKKDPPLSAAEQHRRFEELADETGADTSSKTLRKALEHLAKSDSAAKRKTPER